MFADELRRLPRDIGRLCEVIHGLLIHEADGNMFNVVHIPSRLREINLRSSSKLLQRIFELDDSPLTIARPPKKRLIATCREFGLLLVAMCRCLDIPARLRVGFTKYAYVEPDIMADHIAAEFWHERFNRWVKVDARISSYHTENKIFAVDFDLCDIPDKDFISAGKIWLDCRSGKIDSKKCGFGKKLQFNGLWYVRNCLIHDLAALNKFEMLAWDTWGYMLFDDPPCTDPKNPKQLKDIDQLATVLKTNAFTLDDLHRLWSNPNFKVPSIVISYDRYSGPQAVELAD
jgi:hypothetical protein